MSIFDIFNQLNKEKHEPAGQPDYIIAGLGNPGENTKTPATTQALWLLTGLRKNAECN